MKMPFGKHKDTEISEIPETYLGWVLENTDIHATLRQAIAERLGLDYKAAKLFTEKDVQARVDEAVQNAVSEAVQNATLDGQWEIAELKQEIRECSASIRTQRAEIKKLTAERDRLTAERDATLREQAASIRTQLLNDPGFKAERVAAVREYALEAVKNVYRAASLRHHPDRGGDANRQLALNDLYEALVNRLNAL